MNGFVFLCKWFNLKQMRKAQLLTNQGYEFDVKFISKMENKDFLQCSLNLGQNFGKALVHIRLITS